MMTATRADVTFIVRELGNALGLPGQGGRAPRIGSVPQTCSRSGCPGPVTHAIASR